MGGTSADVGVVVGGRDPQAAQFEFEWGLPIAVPVVDLTTIGAGGSSIAGFDPGGLLRSARRAPAPTRARRRTARAVPLPRSPTRTSCSAASIPTTSSAARFRSTLSSRVGPWSGSPRSSGARLEDAAHAIVDVACENMANAVRLLCADRGLDYRRFDLMAFGGAGPLHAAALARRIGLERVVVPPSPGVGLGLRRQAADLRVDRRLTRVLRSDSRD